MERPLRRELRGLKNLGSVAATLVATVPVSSRHGRQSADERIRRADQFSRSAVVTSMRDARRAGMYDATSVTASIVTGTSASTHGSSALI